MNSVNNLNLLNPTTTTNSHNIKKLKKQKPFSNLISFLDLKDVLSLKLLSRRISDEIDKKIIKEYLKNIYLKPKDNGNSITSLTSNSKIRDYIWVKFLDLEKYLKIS